MLAVSLELDGVLAALQRTLDSPLLPPQLSAASRFHCMLAYAGWGSPSPPPRMHCLLRPHV
jgi:hypothetical protein